MNRKTPWIFIQGVSEVWKIDIDMQSKERLNTLDIAKGIGIIFVVFAHINYTPELLTPIYSFHMPLFFILAGVVFNKEKFHSFGSFLARRWKTMIQPYLFFSVLSIVYVFASERLFDAAKDLARGEYIEAFVQIFLAQGSAPVLDTPLWFVPCLFAVEIMYFFLADLRLKVRIPVCILLTTVGWILESGLLEFDNTLLPWSLDSALFAICFYATGNIVSPYVFKTIKNIKEHPKKSTICLCIFLIAILIWTPLMIANGKITLGSKILNNGFLLYLTGVLGTMAVLSISILADKCRFLTFLGKNTFCIMSVHYVFRKFTLPKYYTWLDIPLYDREVFTETIVPFLIVFVLSILSVLVYNKGRALITKK